MSQIEMTESEAKMWQDFFADMIAMTAIESAMDRDQAEAFADYYRDTTRARLKLAFREAMRRQDERINRWLANLDPNRSVGEQITDLVQALYSDPIETAEYRRKRRKVEVLQTIKTLM